MKILFDKFIDRVMETRIPEMFCGFFLFLLLALFFMPAYTNAAEAPQPTKTVIDRYVIAISANNGGKGRPVLRYAESDANAFAAVLREMGGVNPKNIILVREPSVNKLNKHLDEMDKTLALAKGKSSREEVLVYYSGHADEKGLHLGNETFSWQEFRKRVDGLSADVKIAVIDACGSGAITRAKGGVAVPAFMVDQSSDMKGYAFITSSTQDEASQESDKLKGSFFTHSLVSGLRGAGDLSGDGKVTLSEAYQFAFNETLQKTETTMGGAQHPSRDMNLTGTGDVVMTDLRSTSAAMNLGENIDGRIFIRDDKGELVAELNKKAGRPMSLGLPAGNYSVRLEKKAELKEAKVALADGKRREVSPNDFKTVTTESTVYRGMEIGSVPENSSMDSLDRNGRFRTTFNAVDIEKEPRKGLMLGVFLSKSDDIMLGTQVSLIGNIAKKEMHGMQASSVFNYADNNFEGLQLSSSFNGTRRLEGVQVGSVNYVHSASENAVQVGAINLAVDTIGKTQVGAINLVGYTSVQVGAINIAKDAHVEVGAINITKNVDDTQIGATNIAARANGRQWGVINIVGHADKAPVGLFNIVGNGVWSVTGSINEMSSTAASLHFGTAYLFTALEMSRELEKGFKHYEDIYEQGIGFGTQFGEYGTHLELEYMFLNAGKKCNGNFGYSDEKKRNFHHRLRLGGTIQIIQGIGISAGGSLNLVSEGYLNKILLEPKGNWHDNLEFRGHKGRFWTGLYAGLTLGRF